MTAGLLAGLWWTTKEYDAWPDLFPVLPFAALGLGAAAAVVVRRLAPRPQWVVAAGARRGLRRAGAGLRGDHPRRHARRPAGGDGGRARRAAGGRDDHLRRGAAAARADRAHQPDAPPDVPQRPAGLPGRHLAGRPRRLQGATSSPTGPTSSPSARPSRCAGGASLMPDYVFVGRAPQWEWYARADLGEETIARLRDGRRLRPERPLRPAGGRPRVTGSRRAPAALAAGSVVSGLLAYVLFALVTRGLGAEAAAPVSVLWTLVGLRRRGPHLPAAALDHPQRRRRPRGRRTPRGRAGSAGLVVAAALALGAAGLAAARPPLPPRRRVVPGARRAGHAGLGARSGVVRGGLAGRGRFAAVAWSLVAENALRCVLVGALLLAGDARPGGSTGWRLVAGGLVARVAVGAGGFARGGRRRRRARSRSSAAPRRASSSRQAVLDRRTGAAGAPGRLAGRGDRDVRRARPVPRALHGRAGHAAAADRSGSPRTSWPGASTACARWRGGLAVAHRRRRPAGAGVRGAARPVAAAPGLRQHGRASARPSPRWSRPAARSRSPTWC